jgi:hypothetical protein
MDPWIGRSSLSLDLNVGQPTSSRPLAPANKVLVEENFLPVAKKDTKRVEALEAELRRVSEENARLNEMLRAAVAKHTELQGHVNDMLAAGSAANRQSSASEGGSAASPFRKRIRSDSLDTKPSPLAGGFAVHDQMECKSSAAAVAFHEPGRRIREECTSKVTRRYVHADPSDLSLVSSEHSLSSTSFLVIMELNLIISSNCN